MFLIFYRHNHNLPEKFVARNGSLLMSRLLAVPPYVAFLLAWQSTILMSFQLITSNSCPEGVR